MATAPTKPTTAKKEGSTASGMFAVLTIPICIIVGILIYMFILGDASHYAGGDVDKGNPIDVYGTVHRGGYLVPLCHVHVVLMVIVFSIERGIVIGKASGTGNVDAFVRKV